ncbi:MAG TPA: sodium-translocating pyrophosphatase [Chloroflexia bacterium]|nr:sodium-translocating pyrophosphatase [Chloroflexia bacterium]
MDTLSLLTWFVPIAGLIAIGFAIYLARDVLGRDTGTKEMQEVASTIVEGAMAFLKRQYTTIAILAVVTAVLVGVLLAVIPKSNAGTTVDQTTLGILTSIAFLLGALASGVSGYIGMYVAVRANLRTASAARRSLGEALTVALRGGAVSGFLVVALSLIGVFAIFEIYALIPNSNGIAQAPFLIVGFGFGASFVALFAQLGGGIYTKAADVGADLVGKVEAGIPEDDPRNPAVIADLVGDNVGDCAGRGADLFESTAAENIGAMILGVLLFEVTGRTNAAWILFPLVVRAFGLIASLVGILSARVSGKGGADVTDKAALAALNNGYYIMAVISGIAMMGVSMLMLGNPASNGFSSGFWFGLAGLVGIATSIAFVFITQYYTAGAWRPVREIAQAARTGPATTIISGIAVGFETTFLPTISIALALSGSYWLGTLGRPLSYVDAAGQTINIGQLVNIDVPLLGAFQVDTIVAAGIFGTAVATMGMLMSCAYILAMDTFGPITDNAGGIAEMSHQAAEVRNITDGLDAVGNTTKALTKGYAVGSAALAAFLLFSAYLDKVRQVKPDAPTINGQVPINLSDISVFIGAFIGAMLVFLFSSLAIRAVGRAAGQMIEEVRRQFRADPGIMQGTSRPDYARAVDISARAALREMIAPGLLAVATPVLVGLILGWEAAGGLLMVGTIVGVLLANVLNNGGGAWDNAKKFIESGGLKDESGTVLGKGTDAHKASVVGDTVGDPFKDTAGPSLHVLIKLLSTITLVLAPLFIR